MITPGAFAELRSVLPAPCGNGVALELGEAVEVGVAVGVAVGVTVAVGVGGIGPLVVPLKPTVAVCLPRVASLVMRISAVALPSVSGR